MKTKKLFVLVLCLAFAVMFATLAACDTDGEKPEVTLSNIAVTTNPSKTDYLVGEKFDPSGMVVTATYSDNSTEKITGYTYAPNGALTLSDTTITVTYEGKTAAQPITVTTVPVTLSKIEITSAPAKTSYYVGEAFNPAGMVVKATYSDSTVAAVSGYTYAPNGALTLSDTTITVTYGGKTAAQTITVTPEPATLSKIEITSAPAKTSYYVGEAFNPAGMVVKATYSDNSTADITGYTYAPNGALTLADTTITVTYKGKTAAQTITVAPEPATLSKIEITSAPAKTNYYVGEAFNPAGMVVTATYSDNSTADITGYTYAPDGALTLADTTITVTYKGETAAQTISVTEPLPQKYVFEAEAADLDTVNNKWNVKWGVFPFTVSNSGTGYLADWKGDGKGNKIVFDITSDKAVEAEIGLMMARREKYDIWIGRTASGNKMFSALTQNDNPVTLPDDYFPKNAGVPDYSEWMEKEIAMVSLVEGRNIFSFTVDTDEMYWDYLCLTTTANVTWTREAEVGHHYCDWNVISAPTEEFEGKMYRYCDTCCQKEEVTLPALSTGDAYTSRTVRNATEYLCGLKVYTYNADGGDLEFTVVSEPALGTALDNKIEAESAVLTGNWDASRFVRTNSATVGETQIGMVELNNRKGRLTYTVESSASASVIMILRVAPHTTHDIKVNDALHMNVNGELVGLNDLKIMHTSTAGYWYDFGDYTVAAFDVAEGGNTIVLDVPGNFSYNFDYIVFRSAATITLKA